MGLNAASVSQFSLKSKFNLYYHPDLFCTFEYWTVLKRHVHCPPTEPGTFEFSKPSLLFRESCGVAKIPIERTSGADGIVDVSWKTEDMTAIGDRDYKGGSGVITFAHGETTKILEIVVYDDEVRGLKWVKSGLGFRWDNCIVAS